MICQYALYRFNGSARTPLFFRHEMIPSVFLCSTDKAKSVQLVGKITNYLFCSIGKCLMYDVINTAVSKAQSMATVSVGRCFTSERHNGYRTPCCILHSKWQYDGSHRDWLATCKRMFSLCGFLPKQQASRSVTYEKFGCLLYFKKH